MTVNVDMKELLEAGAHFGHKLAAGILKWPPTFIVREAKHILSI